MGIPIPTVRRLQWKLTLTYALVTTGAILAVELALLLVAALLFLRSEALPQMLVPPFREAGRELASYLEAEPPDRAGAARWLAAFVRSGKIGRNRSQVEVELNPLIVSLAAVADREGRAVAVYPADLCPIGAPLADCLPAAAVPFLARARSGEGDPARLAARVGRDVLLATPVLTPEDRPVGVLLLRISLPSDVARFALELLRTLLPSALVVLLFATAVGTLFGFLTARGLVRRLNALAAAADAWSRGDFTALIHDPSPDELGRLARRLNRMAEELQTLLQTREALAALEERNRLARDLHDAVKQQVFAAGMQIAAARARIDADPKKAKAHLAEAEELVRQAQEELTALIRQLRPAALEGKGLAAALREYVADWSRRTGIRARVRIQGERPLPLPAEQALFRALQEALANVARHSGAARAEVGLAWDDEGLRAWVRDDGRGFDPAAARGKGLGLASMEERIRSVGGTLEVDSRPGAGTTVRMWIPRPTSTPAGGGSPGPTPDPGGAGRWGGP